MDIKAFYAVLLNLCLIGLFNTDYKSVLPAPAVTMTEASYVSL